MRSILVSSYPPITSPSGTNSTSNSAGAGAAAAEKQDIERTIRILMAIPYAVKNHLRSEWASASGDMNISIPSGTADYSGLLPTGFQSHEDDGLALPFQLGFFVDAFIKRGELRGWFAPPAASQLTTQLNSLVEAYGVMETIMLTPIPVAHLYVLLPFLF